MNPFLGTWLVVNAVCVYFIATISVLAIESDYLNILFFPLLVKALREDFTTLGTILVTIFITFCFLPAIILYLAVVILCCIVYMLGRLIIKPFKRKD
jgi:hypothetical protein